MELKTLQTTLHYYHYDVSKPNHLEAYKALRKTISETRKCFEVLARTTSDLLGHGAMETVALETAYLFSNQWNEANGKE